MRLQRIDPEGQPLPELPAEEPQIDQHVSVYLHLNINQNDIFNGSYYFAHISGLIFLSVKFFFFLIIFFSTIALSNKYYLMGFYRLENHQVQSVWRMPCSAVILPRIIVF